MQIITDFFHVDEKFDLYSSILTLSGNRFLNNNKNKNGVWEQFLKKESTLLSLNGFF